MLECLTKCTQLYGNICTYTDGKVESHAAFGVSLQLNIGQVGHSPSRGIQLVVTQQHVVACNSSMYSSDLQQQHVLYSSALHSSQQHVVANLQHVVAHLVNRKNFVLLLPTPVAHQNIHI
jgi:hypothetical protein